MNRKSYVLVCTLLFLGSCLCANSISESRKTAITTAIEKVGSSVASINVIQDLVAPFAGDPWFNYFFPEMFYQKRKARSSGSGVVISPDGYVITNSHVVEKASEVFVSLKGGKEYPAEIIGIDHISDIALLKLNGSDFPYANLSNSDELIIG
ncbi:MAG: trypsin-like peptidase domain-containing protein, partial [Candidatus Marinimicrobia bacterium]|nr:trypsin-like peptidase domain-containing protein [Candidatus Neomarinimicrobiota bacterium]